MKRSNIGIAILVAVALFVCGTAAGVMIEDYRVEQELAELSECYELVEKANEENVEDMVKEIANTFGWEYVEE